MFDYDNLINLHDILVLDLSLAEFILVASPVLLAILAREAIKRWERRQAIKALSEKIFGFVASSEVVYGQSHPAFAPSVLPGDSEAAQSVFGTAGRLFRGGGSPRLIGEFGLPNLDGHICSIGGVIPNQISGFVSFSKKERDPPDPCSYLGGATSSVTGI